MALLQDDVGSAADGATLAFGSNVSAGSGLFAFIGFATATISVAGITDTRGNTWESVVAFAADGKRSEIWRAPNANAGANTLTFDWSGTATAQVCIAEFDGFANGISVDGTGFTFTNVATNHPHASPPITTTQAIALSLSTGRFGGAYNVTAVNDGFSPLTYQGRTIQHYKILSATETHDGDVDTAASESLVGALGVVYQTVPGGGGGFRSRIAGGLVVGG